MTPRIAIDYVSPLPPVRSGISDYSLDLLPGLETLCDLRVARLAGQPVSEEVVRRWRPILPEEVGSEGRLPLYQMGNNEYHEPVMHLALERPGVVTLHDVVLHHLLVEMTLRGGELGPYRDLLVASHGWVGDRAARARQWGELGQATMFTLPAHRTLLRRQRGVLVHSRWAAERVREDDSEIQVRQVPMGIPLPPEPETGSGRAFRDEMGIDATSPLIGSFGFQTPIKRTDRVIAALAQPGLRDTHLLIGGEISPVLDFDADARKAGVSERVHRLGYLDYRRFQSAIAACDLCVNLRYPTAGETSASLLRVLAIGRPAIVSDYAHAGELPDDVVVKIPLGDNEAEVLAEHVGALLSDRKRLQEMAERARLYIRQLHDPARAARAVVEACRELGELEPPGEAPPAVEPPTSLVWREVRGELEVAGGDPPWPEGDTRRLSIQLTNHGPACWLASKHRPGGVIIELHWRHGPWSPIERIAWVGLSRNLEAGQSRKFVVAVRRPLDASMLVIEPHVQGVAGFNALGGPKWVQFL